MSANYEKQVKLRMKANSLIAQDRVDMGHGRDPWPLLWYNHQVETLYRDMAKHMREGLARLTKMGI